MAGFVLRTAGTQSVTAQLGARTATVRISVEPDVPAAFSLSGPTTSTAGVPVSLVLAASDRFGNHASQYTGGVRLTSSDARVVPAVQTLSFQTTDGGARTVAATLATTGTQTFTAVDLVEPTLVGSSPALQVAPGPPHHLALQLPNQAVAGSALLSAFVHAADAYGNPVPSWAQDVTLTADDPNATGPGTLQASSAVNGQLPISGWVLRQARTTRLTAVAGPLQGSAEIFVVPGAATQILLLSPATTTAGVTFVSDLYVLDAQGNPAADFTGTLNFASNDPRAVLPEPTPFTAAMAGQMYLGTVLETAGLASISVQQQGVPSLHTTVPISVAAAAPERLRLTAPPTALAAIPLV